MRVSCDVLSSDMHGSLHREKSHAGSYCRHGAIFCGVFVLTFREHSLRVICSVIQERINTFPQRRLQASQERAP